MNVFEADRILDYASLFISSGSKPTFSSSKKPEDDEEKDPFDDMMEEAEQTKSDEAPSGGLLPESVQKTQSKPDCPLQQKAGGMPYQNNKGGNFQKGGNYNQNYQKQYQNNNYRTNAADNNLFSNFATFDEDEEEPEWNEFDPEKQTGSFFGREIAEEEQLRNKIIEQRERWGGHRKNVAIDEDDEFDAMFEEEMGSKADTEKPQPEVELEALEDDEKDESSALQEDSEYAGAKTLEEISEEVPQDIKDKIIDLEAEQQERLRQTMLRNTFQPKTSALKNLQGMFNEYPVVTNESLKLKMETIGQINMEPEEEVGDDGLNIKQRIFSRLLTSINPFS